MYYRKNDHIVKVFSEIYSYFRTQTMVIKIKNMRIMVQNMFAIIILSVGLYAVSDDVGDLSKRHNKFIDEAMRNSISDIELYNYLSSIDHVLLEFDSSKNIEKNIHIKFKNNITSKFREALFLGTVDINIDVSNIKVKHQLLKDVIENFRLFQKSLVVSSISKTPARTSKVFLSDVMSFKSSQISEIDSNIISSEEMYLFVNRRYLFELSYQGDLVDNVLMQFQQPKIKNTLHAFGISYF